MQPVRARFVSRYKADDNCHDLGFGYVQHIGRSECAQIYIFVCSQTSLMGVHEHRLFSRSIHDTNRYQTQAAKLCYRNGRKTHRKGSQLTNVHHRVQTGLREDGHLTRRQSLFDNPASIFRNHVGGSCAMDRDYVVTSTRVEVRWQH